MMAQREDFDVESGAGAHNAAKRSKQQNQYGRHRPEPRDYRRQPERRQHMEFLEGTGTSALIED